MPIAADEPDPGSLHTFDAVLFDTDGTLVDTEHHWLSSPARCLVLEDSRVGPRAAVAAGTTYVLVTCGAIDPSETRRVTPWVTHDLCEALAWTHEG